MERELEQRTSLDPLMTVRQTKRSTGGRDFRVTSSLTQRIFRALVERAESDGVSTSTVVKRALRAYLQLEE